MSEGSEIGWLHQPGYTAWTLNVGIGCTVRSEGCNECYAPKWAIRQAHYAGRDGIVTHDAIGRPVWTGKVITFPERLARPLKVRKPHMIFLNAMMELFDPQVDDDFLTALWQMMADTPQHIYVILSKLPKRMHDIVTRMVARFGVLPNLWLGCSAENQHQADIRIPWLVRTPAAIRVVSVEPMLTPVSLRSIPFKGDTDYLIDVLHRRYRTNGPPTDGWGTTPFHSGMAGLGGIDWVIVGGETARKDRARPMHPRWARDLIKQATDARVAVFFKQHGSWGPAPWVVRVCDPEQGWHGTDAELVEAKARAEAIGATHSLPVWADQYDMKPREVDHKPWSLERRELTDDTHAPMRFFAGKGAGHVLDGRVWQQWPTIGGRIIEAPREQEMVNV
jgi:protein gp37